MKYNEINKVATIVVTYNRLELLKKNIEALNKIQCDCMFDILIIDNASTDGTKEYIGTLKEKNIKYYNTGKNIGGAGGFNFGIKKAAEQGYKWIWLMDDDTMPAEDSLQKLLEVDKKLQGQYGFLSSRVLWKDGTQCLMNCPQFKHKKINQDKLETPLTQISQASFVSMFMRTETVLEVGLPIKEFFIWGDDVEYTRRISLRYEKNSYMVKDSKVYHLMKVNKGSNIAIDEVERIGRYRYAFRNEFYTYKQEGLGGVMYYLAKCAFNIVRVLLISSSDRSQRCDVIIKAMLEGKSFNPSIEYIK
ncbi:glycosyltransferase family 2 protein [uncultured Megasphaera sp.]|uniref:glycosyltransferase family 2 protein n=1 Tax=uncultured Megasphaera sp. TaxID=165188 RepID=UPI0025D2766F|nr:glycosyltransferase family 2 protein [uncultured Megasphaera sp.]